MPGFVRVGLIGAGKFGGYHAGKIAGSQSAAFSGIFDMDVARATALAEAHDVSVFKSADDLFEASDAVIIASPAQSHFEVCKAALEAGCHVLVEKPLALRGDAARELVALAGRTGKVLQVGHQERLVCEALGLLAIQETPFSIEIMRAGPPPKDGRAMDVSVIWDLMIHDIDLVHMLAGPRANQMACEGEARLGTALDHAVARLQIGHTQVELTASRIAEVQERFLKIQYKTGVITLDFLARTVANTTEHKVRNDLAGLVPDPLGAADALFFAACGGQANTIMKVNGAVQAVATAERLQDLATVGLGV